VPDLVHLDVGHIRLRNLRTTTDEAGALTEATTAKAAAAAAAAAHHTATVTEALVVSTTMTGRHAIVHLLAGQRKITRHLEPAMKNLTVAITLRHQPTLM
jgi:hypothetical protein